MTLREKFNNVEIMFESQTGQLRYDELLEASNDCVRIADDYAIELLEWLTNEKSKFSIMYGNQEKRFSTIEEDYTAKELLEIFKKEKQL